MSNAHRAASHNPGLCASGKPPQSGKNLQSRELKTAALRLMKCLGLVPTFRNLYIVQLAIETERDLSATDNKRLAQEGLLGPGKLAPLELSIPAATDRIIFAAEHARYTGETVNYFWFEDSMWRFSKLSFRERDSLREQQFQRGW